jgi:hypothetical protein
VVVGNETQVLHQPWGEYDQQRWIIQDHDDGIVPQKVRMLCTLFPNHMYHEMACENVHNLVGAVQGLEDCDFGHRRFICHLFCGQTVLLHHLMDAQEVIVGVNRRLEVSENIIIREG